MSKYTRSEIIALTGINADQITISNGNAKSKACSRIYNSIGNVVFETTRVWKGYVSINKKEMQLILDVLL